MQNLEKILEEIDETIERYGTNPYIDVKVTDLCYGLNIAKDIIRRHMNDGWIPVKVSGFPKHDECYHKFWITIEYDNGNRRVVEATWDYFCKCFAYKNNKKVLQDVVAYMQYCEPKPYSPEPLETRKNSKEGVK